MIDSRPLSCVVLLACAAGLTACVPYARIMPPDEIYVEKAGKDPAGNARVLVDQGFKVALNQYLNANGDSTKEETALPRLFKESIGLADYQCMDYFNRLGRASRDLAWTRYETSLTGGVVSSMLGLAGQSAKAIANTGAAFGFTTASMDNYESNYLFSPDVGAVQILVKDAQQKVKASWNGVPKIESWGQLISHVKEYEDVCQPHSIRHLINASLIKGAASTAQFTLKEPVPAGKLSETKLDFGISAPNEKPVKLKSVYTQQAENAATVLALVSTSALFKLSDQSTCKPLLVLKQGDSCLVALEFSGSKVGTYSASVYMINDLDAVVSNIKLTGVIKDK